MDGYLRTVTPCCDLNLSLAAIPRSATFMMPRSPHGGGRVLVSTTRLVTSSSPTRSQSGLFSKCDDIFYHKVRGGLAPRCQERTFVSWNARA
eukprot:5556417-Pyramimonas_sp.AAC.1